MKIDHASGLENNIVLVLRRRVYRCSDCSYIFKENNPFKIKQTKLSKEKEIQILNQLRNKNSTFKDVANMFNVSIS